MTEQEMFEKTFKRPRNFFSLTPQEQWDIDKKLGILDWDGSNLTNKQIIRYNEYYDNDDDGEDR